MELEFKLDDNFIERYSNLTPKWGFPSGPGMTLGELIYLRTYSRKKEDGSKEKWHETVRRVVEGSYSIQKDHILNKINTVWDEDKAQASSREMYERMHSRKFWSPGRGLENMGTAGVNGWGYSDRLFNCAFQSTADGGTEAFARLFAMSMKGVGVGFDTRGAGKDTIHEPQGHFPYTIADSTEGWVSSTQKLLDAFYYGTAIPRFNYDSIRRKGSYISSGGIAPGPEPLRQLHVKLEAYLRKYIGKPVSSRNIVDICNLIGKAVVSGGKRRTALIALGLYGDEDFTNLKDFTLPENAERMGPNGWAWASNNSLIVNSTDEIDFDWYATRQLQAEPGLFVQDLVQNYGRLADGYQEGIDPAIGTNPCGEISLENGETCNVVTVNMAEHDSLEDFLRTIKYVFLYAKSVTLMPTSWPSTNVVSMRNRRIGCSVTGVVQFAHKHGLDALKRWLDDGYREIQIWDKEYSRWLCVRESIKLTTVKPEGSASLLAGATPGVHFPTEATYIRRVQFDIGDPLLESLSEAGYHIEPFKGNPETTVVVELPVKGPQVPTEKDVSVYTKLELAMIVQQYWADNSVSFTLTFHEHEKDQLADALKTGWGRYKSITCSPIYEPGETGREMQLPYEAITNERYDEIVSNIKPVDFTAAYDGDAREAVGDKFCDGDACTL